MNRYWQTSRRKLSLEHVLVMGILNVTPDSFSDGGKFSTFDTAIKRAEQMIAEGADILDIGGESTRPNSSPVSIDEETSRVIPLIDAIAKRFDVPISIDTTKAEVARQAITAGAEIINDISGLRFDENIGIVAAEHNAALILMHSRGSFETMHSTPPVANILQDVADGFRSSIEKAKGFGVKTENIVLDIGIGFGKTLEQNLELLRGLDTFTNEFAEYPMLVGTSRKSFIGKLLGGVPADERSAGSIASIAIAVYNGAKIVRVHDVKETVQAVKIAAAIKAEKNYE